MTGQQETIRLEYEAYETMAYSELTRLAKDVSERFSLHRLVVVHRLGIVPRWRSKFARGVFSTASRECVSCA